MGRQANQSADLEPREVIATRARSPHLGQPNMHARPVTLWIAATLLAVSAMLLPRPGLAQQLFWDWGGGDAVGASGREVVRFPPSFGGGQLVVRVGVRMRYCITAVG